jgi:tetratricopeptide (TPR) repeat protein
MRQFNPRLVVLPMEIIRQARIASARDAESNFRVDWAVIGSLDRSSNQLAVRLSLWDARRGALFTNHVLTVPLAQAQGFQDRLAELTASWVGLAVPPSAAEAGRAGQTQAPEAFLAYLDGLGHLAQKDRVEALDTAIDAFQRALELDPNYAQAHTMLAEALWARFRTTREARWITTARAHALKAMELAPRLVKAKVALASICLGTGEAEQAGEILQEALRLEPANLEAMVALGRVYEQRKQFSQAEAVLRNAAARQTGWSVLIDLASFYYRVGRYADAEGAFKNALKLTPDNALVLLDLGGLYYLLGRQDEAVVRLNESLKAHPLPEAYSNLGTIFFFDGEYRRAIDMFLQAVALGDRNPELWGNLADAYRANGEREKAQATYRTAVTLAGKELAVNPVNGEMQALLGTYLAALGDKELALARARTARQLEPANPSVAFLSALVHELADDRSGALTELHAAIRNHYPTNQVWLHPDLAALRQDPRFRSVLDDR